MRPALDPAFIHESSPLPFDVGTVLIPPTGEVTDIGAGELAQSHTADRE